MSTWHLSCPALLPVWAQWPPSHSWRLPSVQLSSDPDRSVLQGNITNEVPLPTPSFCFPPDHFQAIFLCKLCPSLSPRMQNTRTRASSGESSGPRVMPVSGKPIFSCIHSVTGWGWGGGVGRSQASRPCQSCSSSGGVLTPPRVWKSSPGWAGVGR